MNTRNGEKSVSVFMVARMESSRCPNKVSRNFAQGKSLFEVMCISMKDLNYPFFAAVGEPELADIADKHQIPIIHRKKSEVTSDRPLRSVFACVEQCTTSHILLISPCTPFLNAATVNAACEYLIEGEHESISSAIVEQNWFFNKDRKPFFPINVHDMTSNDLCVYAMANAFEGFPVKRFLDEGIYYTFEDASDPYLYEIPKSEATDINTEEEFELAAMMWKARHSAN